VTDASGRNQAPKSDMPSQDSWHDGSDHVRTGGAPEDLASFAGDALHWEQVWSSIQSTGDRLFTRGQPRSLRQLWQRCYFEDLWHVVQGARIGRTCCELGSGRGTTSMYLMDLGCDVTMVDLAPSAFDAARAAFEECGVPFPCMVLADAQDTGLPASSFDFVYNIGVLEHFEDPEPLLGESLRILKPGGIGFMVIVPRSSRLTGWLPRALLNPVKLMRLIAGSLTKGLYREDSAPTVRTRYRNEFWENSVSDSGGVEVGCVSYNPYAPVYRSQSMENAITVPLYRAHYRSKRSLCSRPLALQTSGTLALCQLLLFRAP